MYVREEADRHTAGCDQTARLSASHVHAWIDTTYSLMITVCEGIATKGSASKRPCCQVNCTRVYLGSLFSPELSDRARHSYSICFFLGTVAHFISWCKMTMLQDKISLSKLNLNSQDTRIHDCLYKIQRERIDTAIDRSKVWISHDASPKNVNDGNHGDVDGSMAWHLATVTAYCSADRRRVCPTRRYPRPGPPTLLLPS
jgi:hypothetical protein